MADPAAEFGVWLAAQGRAPNTVAAYRRDVAAYLRWRERDESSADGTSLGSYVEHLQATRAAASAARSVVALRVFYRWKDADYAARPELVGLPTPSGRSEPDLDETTVARLLAATVGDAVGRRRDAVAIGLLYFAGLKVSEAISVDIADLAQSGATLAVDRGGAHERVLPVVPALHAAVARWLDNAGRPRLEPSSSAILVNRRGQRLSRQGLWLLTRGVARRAGVAPPPAPNDLRRACAAHLAANSVPAEAVGAFLGQTRGAPPNVTMLNAYGWGSCNLAV